MKLFKFLNQHEMKCKTCNIMISLEDINTHKSHDVRIRQKLKYFILDIVINFAFMISGFAILTYLVILPLIEELIKMRGMISA